MSLGGVKSGLASVPPEPVLDVASYASTLPLHGNLLNHFK